MSLSLISVRLTPDNRSQHQGRKLPFRWLSCLVSSSAASAAALCDEAPGPIPPRELRHKARRLRRLKQTRSMTATSYDHARKRLPEAEELSDLYSEIEQPKRRRRRARRYSTDSDSDDSYQFAAVPQQEVISGQEPPILVLQQGWCHSKMSLRQLVPIMSLQEILPLLHIIQFKLNEHALKLELLTTLVSNSNDENILVSGESFGPFNELATFLDFDASVASSEEKKKRLMVSWGKYGGSSGPDMTRRILVGLLSDDIAVQYSFKGGKGKRKFNELACWEIIKETVKAQGKLSGATDYDVEQTVKSWLAHSKERLDKAAKTRQKPSSHIAFCQRPTGGPCSPHAAVATGQAGPEPHRERVGVDERPPRSTKPWKRYVGHALERCQKGMGGASCTARVGGLTL
ncbi:uncharacterized protein ISCGN_026765 [Ixodes scapularis]